MKMKGSDRDLTSALSSDHGGERDPAMKVRRIRHCQGQRGMIRINLE